MAHAGIAQTQRRRAQGGATTMSRFTWREVACAGGTLAALVGAWAGATVAQEKTAQEKTAPPIFSWDSSVGWIGVGGFQPVPGRVAPLSQDPKYPFVPNGQGRQPTYRIADLSNANLKPAIKEIMKKDNDEVLAGKIAYSPSASCMPSGVPAFLGLGGNQNP